jgi:hypothetical protein
MHSAQAGHHAGPHHAALQHDVVPFGSREIGLRQGVARQLQRVVARVSAERRVRAVGEIREGIGKPVVEVVNDRVAPPGLALHVDYDIDAHGRAKHQAAVLRLVGIARLPVDGHDDRPMPLEAQRHQAGKRPVDQPEANSLAGPHRLVHRQRAVEGDGAAGPPGHRCLHAVAEIRGNRPVLAQAPVR